MTDTSNEWCDEPIRLGIFPGTRTTDVGDITYWQNLFELRKASGLCLEKEYWLSAAKLIYSGIDNLAWLTREHNRPEVEPQDFIDFVKKYLLPDPGLACSADELYGARCGLLHSNTAESRKSRSSNTKVRQIVLVTGLGTEEGCYDHIPLQSHNRLVAVHINKLYSAYNKSIDKLSLKISKDEKFADCIYSRSVKLYAELPED